MENVKQARHLKYFLYFVSTDKALISVSKYWEKQ